MCSAVDFTQMDNRHMSGRRERPLIKERERKKMNGILQNLFSEEPFYRGVTTMIFLASLKLQFRPDCSFHTVGFKTVKLAFSVHPAFCKNTTLFLQQPSECFL